MGLCGDVGRVCVVLVSFLNMHQAAASSRKVRQGAESCYWNDMVIRLKSFMKVF